MSGSVTKLQTASSSTTTTGTITSEAQDVIVIGIHIPSATVTVSSVTDSTGNVYSYQSRTHGTGVSGEVWIAPSAAASASNTITITLSGALANWAIAAGSYSGGVSFDTAGSAVATSGTSVSVNVNAQTAGDVIIALVFLTTAETTSGLTTGYADLPGTGTSYHIHQSYLLSGVQGTNSFAETIAGSSQNYVAVAIALTTIQWTAIAKGGKPVVTVSPNGIANGKASYLNNGADFGPDTAGTGTSGIQEALNSLGTEGGHVYLLQGTFIVTAATGIQWPNVNGIVLEGSGSVMTTVSHGNATVITDAAGINISGCGVINNQFSTCVVWRNFSVYASKAQYGIYWQYSGYVGPPNVVEVAILELFENVEATSAPSSSQQNYGWYLVGFEQMTFLNCGNGFSNPYNSSQNSSGYGVSVTCPSGNARFFACDFQGNMNLSTQESNLFETTVEQGVTCLLGRFYMFGGALYDSGSYASIGGPVSAPCLVTADVTHCTGVIFNAMYQTSNYYVVTVRASKGSNAAYNDGNAQAATFESCIFNMLWNTPSTVTVYAVYSPTPLGSCLRVLKQCEFYCGASATGAGPLGIAKVLQTNGTAVVENCVYIQGPSMGILPPGSGDTIPANPPASGTIYQNTNPQAIEIYLTVTYNIGGSGVATMTPALGATSPPTNLPMESQPAGVPTYFARTYRLRVPAGWFFSFTVNLNAALGSATIIEM